MTGKVKLPGQSGEWEEVCYTSEVDKAPVMITYRRLPSPPPMPEIGVGTLIGFCDRLRIIRAVRIDGLFETWNVDRVDSLKPGLIRLTEIQEVFDENGQSIWKRG